MSINKILKYACQNCDYYKDYDFNNFDSFPVLERNIVEKEKNRILSKNYPYVISQDLLVFLTSGSTGKPLEIYWDKSDSLSSNLTLWRYRYKYYGILPTDRYCSTHIYEYTKNRVKKCKKVLTDSRNNNISICRLYLDDDSFKEYYLLINEFKPKWFFIQSSFLIKFINYMIKNELPFFPTVKYIELTGENLLLSDRKKIEDFTNCKIANMYGTTETNGIAIECPYHNMHIIEKNVYVEVQENEKFKDDSRSNILTGSALVTSLTNKEFPLIRYKVGDIISITTDKIKCQCGEESRLVKKIYGKENSKIIINEQIISEYTISYVFEYSISLFGYYFDEYYVKKNLNNSSIDIFIIINNDFIKWKERISQVILDSLKEFYDNIKFNIIFTDVMNEPKRSGKRQIMENNNE